MTTNRPGAVPWWIKNARPLNKIPHNINLTTFSGEVTKWWASIQPSWRTPNGADEHLSHDVPETEDWDCLLKGGPNGLFLVVMCLYWWRHIATEEKDSLTLSQYQFVAEDLVFVFTNIFHRRKDLRGVLRHPNPVSPSSDTSKPLEPTRKRRRLPSSACETNDDTSTRPCRKLRARK